MTGPFTGPRPGSYPPIPNEVRPRHAVKMQLQPGSHGFPPAPTIRFLGDAPTFLLDLNLTHGDTASFFLNGELFIAFFGPEGVVDVTVKK